MRVESFAWVFSSVFSSVRGKRGASGRRGAAWLAAFAAAAVALAPGCRTPPSSDPPAATAVPVEARLVGGGETINFAAPEPGIAFLFDRRSSRVVSSISLRQGEHFYVDEEKVSSDWSRGARDLPCRADALSLYFLPERELQSSRSAGGTRPPPASPATPPSSTVPSTPTAPRPGSASDPIR